MEQKSTISRESNNKLKTRKESPKFLEDHHKHHIVMDYIKRKAKTNTSISPSSSSDHDLSSLSSSSTERHKTKSKLRSKSKLKKVLKSTKKHEVTDLQKKPKKTIKPEEKKKSDMTLVQKLLMDISDKYKNLNSA